jgi:hypothetical protein
MAGKDLENFNFLSELVDRRFIAYVYAKERTATFDSVIASWSKKILQLESTASTEEILQASREATGFRIPGLPEMIKSGIETLSYSKKSHAKRLRYVLARVSKHLDAEAREGDWGKPITDYLTTVRSNVPGMDMDHILGQTYLTNESEENQRIFNSIGALTLVFSSDHREDTKTKPHEKVNMYKKSRYIFTQSLAPLSGSESERVRNVIENIQVQVPINLNKWDTATVTKRTSYIVGTFLTSLGAEDLS